MEVKIAIRFDTRVLHLTLEEAEELYRTLGNTLGKNTQLLHTKWDTPGFRPMGPVFHEPFNPPFGRDVWCGDDFAEPRMGGVVRG